MYNICDAQSGDAYFLHLRLLGCQHFRVGLALDAYLIPVEDGIESNVEQPLLFINTWTFQWPENVAKIKSLVDTNEVCDSECLYVYDSVITIVT